MTVRPTDLFPVPNLDNMTVEELWGFWKDAGGAGMRYKIGFARLLFPARPPGYVKATRALRNYAANKATAIDLRLTGNVDAALGYEKICERIYSDLPGWACWDI